MYRIPMPYICPVCQTKTHSHTPDSVCMKCFAEFIAKHVPKVVPDPNGQPFDPSQNIANY